MADAVIDVGRSRFPYCIVWTPIPCITWFFPFVGHMGIADSQGMIHDFAGPYFVGKDDMAFGKPTRYLQLNPARQARNKHDTVAAGWDAAVDVGDQVYCQRMHNLFCDNCHSHVARCLNTMAYDSSTSWNMIKLAIWIFFCGKQVTLGRTIASYLPFVILVTVIVVASTVV